MPGLIGSSAYRPLLRAEVGPHLERSSSPGDIHTLFDLHLIGLIPQTMAITLGSVLKKTSYSDLQGKQLILPADSAARPTQKALAARWQDFSANEPKPARSEGDPPCGSPPSSLYDTVP